MSINPIAFAARLLSGPEHKQETNIRVMTSRDSMGKFAYSNFSHIMISGRNTKHTNQYDSRENHLPSADMLLFHKNKKEGGGKTEGQKIPADIVFTLILCFLPASKAST